MIGRSLIKMNGGIVRYVASPSLPKNFNDTGRKVNLSVNILKFSTIIARLIMSFQRKTYPLQSTKVFFEVNFMKSLTDAGPTACKANVFKAHVVEQFYNQLGLTGISS